ncbi:MAG: phosphoenolpyruvate carboxykinase [Alphaproteobacteria bacterium]|nr:phosphoenolpyruvate carboxykinase [Alphaproteobacteria bacterium]
MNKLSPLPVKAGLEAVGLRNLDQVHWNLGPAALYEHAVRNGEGRISEGGALVVDTGRHTGRSPKDKFFVEEAGSRDEIDWGAVNKSVDQATFDMMHKRAAAYLQGKSVYVQDLFAGADADHRLNVRVVTQTAWHNLFARNMFIRPAAADRTAFSPDFTIINVPGLEANGPDDGLNSETFILVDLSKKLILIGGTWYAGEIKKSIFTILNYLLPDRGVMPMHCSANIGPDGDVAVFFGLSGTGKTTLSADSRRTLIGDDEHGWSDNGVFNFEGGCYAKVIRLSEEAEPEIFATTKRFGTVLENVVMNPETGALDLDDAAMTENTRACYPIDFIPNMSLDGAGGQPANVIMLTADAFGVLPPISRLSPEQAMYHFLSGYTARVAGTEKGLGSEPQATFSTCFGAPFMPRHPTVYAKMLGERIAKTGARCWLVNTGWSGGKPGVGKRMSIAHTRSMINAALDGGLDAAPMRQDPAFGLTIPESCPGVPADVLDPRSTWADKDAYDATAKTLCGLFEDNFKQFEAHVDAAVTAAGIKTKA